MLLNYRIYGEGDPVVILHGLFGTLENWNTQSRMLSETHCVVAVDLRNHGMSPHSDDFDYGVMVEDLCQLYAHLGLESASCIGHSMGGKVAMHLALSHPEMVKRLMVVDIAPRAYPPGHQAIFEALLAIDLKAHSLRASISEALAVAIPDLTVRNFLLKNLTRSEDASWSWKMNLNGIYRNYEKINSAVISTGQYTGRTVFVRGGRSNYVHDEDMEEIRKLFPYATLLTVERAGHWVHAEAPEEFGVLVRDFLAL